MADCALTKLSLTAGEGVRRTSASLRAALEGFRGECRFDEPLSAWTSLKIGGPADALVIPADLEDLRLLVRQASGVGLPVTVLGGTNVLVRDGGIRGIVVLLMKLAQIRYEPPATVYAQAGLRMPLLLQYTVNRSLSGLEWAAGIPGTVGGGVAMNAGTRLGEMKDVLHAIEVLDVHGDVTIYPASAIPFEYRRAQLPAGIVVGAWFRLRSSTKREIEAMTKEYLHYRKATQPLAFPNAGSVFRNPYPESAGSLIERAGLKGLRIGDAQISSQHANFIVNVGQARASEVIQLIQHVRHRVFQQFGVTLHLELKVVGEP